MLTIPIFLLTLAIGVLGANSLVLSPVAVQVAASFAGASAPDVPLAAAAYGAGTALSAFLIAPHADRIGVGRSLLIAMSVLALALAMSAMAPSLPFLALAQALAGLSAGLAIPSIYALATILAPSGAASRVLGLVLTGWTLSLVAGVSISAIIADYLHWRTIFIGLASLAGIILALLWNWLPRDTRRAQQDASTSWLAALRIPQARLLLCLCALYSTAFYGLYAYLGTHIQTVFASSASTAGVATFSYGVGFGLAVLLDGRLGRIGPRGGVVMVFAGLAGVYLSLALSAEHFAALLAACFVWGIINHLGLNLVVGQLAGLSAPHRATLLGLNSTVMYVCVLVGTLSYRPVFDQGGFGAASLLSAGCMVVATALSLYGYRAGGRAVATGAAADL